MSKRFAVIWFRYLTTDRMIRRHPELKPVPFVLAAPEHGKVIVKAASAAAHAKGIQTGMAVADCRAIFPELHVLDDQPGMAGELLEALAEWTLRYTPIAAVDMPDGLVLDISGCAHLWGGEQPYLEDILTRLKNFGYDVRAAIADTAGAAWAVSRFGKTSAIIYPGKQAEAILSLSPAALRLEPGITERLAKLGLMQISSFISMPRNALRRRFGPSLLSRLDQALGQEMEVIEPIRPVVPCQERLPSLEPIRTSTGIEIAIMRLLENICRRLQKEGKGLRTCLLKAFRVDGNMQQIGISTIRPSRNAGHLYKLFETKISDLEPDLGFELFLLEAPILENLSAEQETIWHTNSKDDEAVAELLDRIGGKAGMHTIQRYLPAEHYWPERSIKKAATLQEKATTAWRSDLPRPIHLLTNPEPINVTVALPDYPPMLFRYKGKLHNIAKADGPERIEQEWWVNEGLYRDYYCVEDADGARYWVFRSGPYDAGEPEWFIHGFFA